MTTKPEFILYDAANSPCGRRVRFCLLEKEQAFEIRWLNLGLMDQKQSWYLDMNPGGVVPTLVHGDYAVFESNIINEYIETIVPEPALVPSDPLQQIEMRKWIAFELEWAKPFREAIYQTYGKTRLKDTGIDEQTLIQHINKRTDNPAYTKMAVKNLSEDKNQQVLDISVDLIMERIQWMEKQLSDEREWLLGDTFSLADIALAPRLDLFSLIEVEDFYERFSNISAYMQRVKQRPAWKRSALLPDATLSPTLVESGN